MNINRRTFIKYAGYSSVAIPAMTGALAYAGGHLPKLDEADPQAMALGYMHDTNQVDNAKHEASQVCKGCALYSGKEGDDWGPCGIFPGKEVAAMGWCTAFVAKP